MFVVVLVVLPCMWCNCIFCSLYQKKGDFDGDDTDSNSKDSKNSNSLHNQVNPAGNSSLIVQPDTLLQLQELLYHVCRVHSSLHSLHSLMGFKAWSETTYLAKNSVIAGANIPKQPMDRSASAPPVIFVVEICSATRLLLCYFVTRYLVLQSTPRQCPCQSCKLLSVLVQVQVQV